MATVEITVSFNQNDPVSNFDNLYGAISAATLSGGGAANTNYVIHLRLTSDAVTLSLLGDLPDITLASGSTLTIDGTTDFSHALSQAPENDTINANGFRGFVVDSGNVTIKNLNIVNAIASGGAGGTGGGGGGAGLGGAVFVGAGANVTLTNVGFTNNTAVGGDGGAVDPGGGGGGGGGLGGNGGLANGGGGGGGGIGGRNAFGFTGRGGDGFAASPSAATNGTSGTVGGQAGGGVGNDSSGVTSGAGTQGGGGSGGGDGGGGGGVAGGDAFRIANPVPGDNDIYGFGGNGGNGGGGGGGGFVGGNGGFGGGGGGGGNEPNVIVTVAGQNEVVFSTHAGGTGGFGGGGGGSLGTPGASGFGGGAGSASGGGGGFGAGGDVFVQQGGTLNVTGGALSGGTAHGGAGANGGGNGSNQGGGLFIQGTLVVHPTTTVLGDSGTVNTVTSMQISDSIVDEKGISGTGSTGSLLVTGGGTLFLTGSSSYLGGTDVQNGDTVSISSDSGLGGDAGGVTLRAGAQLEMGGSFTFGHVVALGGEARVNVDPGFVVTDTAAITESSAGSRFDIGGGGTLTLTNHNTYTGGTFVDGGATLSISADDSIGPDAGLLTLFGSTLSVTQSFAFAHALALDSSTISVTAGKTMTDTAAISGGALSVDGGGTLSLAHAANTYAATVILSATLEVSALNAAGTGAISFTNGLAGTLKIDNAALSNSVFGNAIDHLTSFDTIILTGLSYDPLHSSVIFDASTSTLRVTNGSITDMLTLTNPAVGVYSVSSDGAGGTKISSVATRDFIVTNAAELNSAITQIDVSGPNALANTHYTITLANDISLTSELYAFNLMSGSSVSINGSDGHGGAFKLDGLNVNRGFFVYSGTVDISDLSITHTLAKGGDGNLGGGGGAGLGSGVFVASGAHVMLDDVSFDGDAAIGGNGAIGNSQTGGGGGLGGNGGADGGGGIGYSAAGTDSGFNNGGDGIILGVPRSNVGEPRGSIGGLDGGGGGANARGTGGGGGIGGSINLSTAPFPYNERGGDGGFGGGGGGSIDSGGFGGFGGGGGGSFDGTGGFGGFGGGGGGSEGSFLGLLPGFGGFGGGNGGQIGSSGSAGGGGLGAGGGIFVQQGGTLTVGSGSLSGGKAQGGLAGAVQAVNGSGFGDGIFIQGNQTITFNPHAGETLTIQDQIVDQSGEGGTGGNAGVGNILIQGGGKVVMTASAANAYTGTTEVSGTGTELSIAANANLGSSGTILKLDAGTQLDFTSSFTLSHAINVSGDPTFNVAPGVTVIDTSVISDGTSAGDVVVTGGGTLVLDAVNTYSGGTTIQGSTLRLELLGAAGSGAIGFATGQATTLDIDTAALGTASGGVFTFGNRLDGFTVGDVIDLDQINFLSGATITLLGGNVLSVVNNGVTYHFNLHSTENFAGATFAAGQDSAGHLEIGFTNPFATNDTAAVLAGQSVSTATRAAGVLGDDVEIAPGFVLTVTAFSNTAHESGTVGSPLVGLYGDLTLNADGTYTYAADNAGAIAAAASGSHPADIFSYTETNGHSQSSTGTLTVTVDRAPVALADTVTAIAGVATVSGSAGVLVNDSDPDGDALTITGVSNTLSSAGTLGTALAGVYGSLTLSADGSYSYIANNTAAINAAAAGTHPSEVFTYTESDGQGGTTTQTLTVTIERVPALTADSNSTFVGGPAVTGNLLANDHDADGDSLAITSFINTSNVPGTFGTTLAGQFGSLVLTTDGTYTYTPNASITGAGQHTDVFTYTVTDAFGGQVSTTLAIALDRVPVAVADASLAVSGGAAATGNVLGNDTDADSDTLTVSSFTDGGVLGTAGTLFHGTYGDLTLNSNGTFSYSAGATSGELAAIAAAATGSDPTEIIAYTASDGQGGTSSANLTMKIDRLPVAVADTNVAVSGGSVAGAVISGSILTNDTDADGDTLTVTGFTDGSAGTLGSVFHATYGDFKLNANGTYTYTPGATAGERTAFTNAAPGSHPADTFTYTASDGHATTTSTLTIALPPIVNSVTASTVGNISDLDAAKVVTITVNFSDTVVVTGTPELQLNDSEFATYTGGTGTSALTFSYAVQPNDNIADLQVQGLLLNNGTIQDGVGNNASVANAVADLHLQIDTTAPSPPPTLALTHDTGASSGDKITSDPSITYSTPAVGDTLFYKADNGSSFSTVVPTFATDHTAEGQHTVTVEEVDGAGNISTASLTFTLDTIAPAPAALALLHDTGVSNSDHITSDPTITYSVSAAGDALLYSIDSGSYSAVVPTFATDGPHTVSIEEVDAAGNISTATSLSFTLDTTVPAQTSVTAVADNSQHDVGISHLITITVDTGEAVTVTGTPTLTLDDGRTASYAAGSGTTQLTFDYTVAAGDVSADLHVTGYTGTIHDVAGNALAPVSGDLGLQIDGVAPTGALSFVTDSGGTDLNQHHVVTFTLNTSEAVAVTGSPELQLSDGEFATYSSSASAATSLVFDYTVAAGDTSTDLHVAGTNPNGGLVLNGGSILDAAGNPLAGSVSTDTHLIIDTTAPTYTGITASPGSGVALTGSTVHLTLDFSEAVTLTGTPTLSLNDGATATYDNAATLALHDTSKFVFDYLVSANDQTPSLAVTGFTSHGATVADLAGNAANLNHVTAAFAALSINETIAPAFTTGGLTRPELELDPTGHIMLDSAASDFAALYGTKLLYMGLPASTPFPPVADPHDFHLV